MTATITNPGRELADKLNPYIGTTTEILQICSLIARHARTHGRLQEIACTRMMEDWEVKQEERISERIKELIGNLPHTDEGPILPNLTGDPRGYTVKLVLPPCYRAGDTWGGHEEGIFVPNS